MSALMPVPAPVAGMSGFRHGLRAVLRLWERLAMYLPLLMMALLALGTYWLVRNTPPAPAAEPARAVTHEVDYFMRRVTVKTFDDTGRLKSELFGTQARHFPDTETLEIDQVRMRAVNPQGLLTTATANLALSNDAGNEVQLIGNALVIRESQQQADGTWLPRLEFRGEFLHVFMDDERVKSHLPVVLTRGQDQFRGDTLAYDNLTQVADLQGRVKGILMPRRAVPAKAPAR